MPTEEEIVALIRETAGIEKDILCGIGDDAAILKTKGNLLVTTDMLVEGVHFKREYASFYNIGKKSVAVNVSDIAAMAGTPKWALLCLGLPPALSLADIKELIGGIVSEADAFGVKIVGGDISRAETISISLTLLGEAPGKPILRSSAKEGDNILVTGTLGDAAAGLKALEQKLDIPTLIKKHLNPTPRLEVGHVLAKEKLARSLIDLSDGLGSDLNRLCKESGVGARIYACQIPLSPQLIRHAPSLEQSACDFALYGGEDYELLFTTSPEKTDIIDKFLSIQISVIGKIVSQEHGIHVVYPDGQSKPLEWGFDHFPDR